MVQAEANAQQAELNVLHLQLELQKVQTRSTAVSVRRLENAVHQQPACAISVLNSFLQQPVFVAVDSFVQIGSTPASS
jgi:hypothetical protein